MKWTFITRYYVFDISGHYLSKAEGFSDLGYNSKEEAQQAIIREDTSHVFYIIESLERVPEWED